MKNYHIRVNISNDMFIEYSVTAKNIMEAKNKVEKAYFEDFPNASKNVVYSLRNPDNEKIKDILIAIKESV